MTVQALKAMTAKEKPNVVFLMETKNSEAKVHQIQRYLHFLNSYILNPVGIAGRLTVFWNAQVSIQVLSSSQHMLDMTCKMLQEDRTIHLTCIHAPYNYNQR